jgi:hypothetical protein
LQEGQCFSRIALASEHDRQVVQALWRQQQQCSREP